MEHFAPGLQESAAFWRARELARTKGGGSNLEVMIWNFQIGIQCCPPRASNDLDVKSSKLGEVLHYVSYIEKGLT